MKQLFAFMFAGIIAAFCSVGQGPAIAQTQVQYKASKQIGAAKNYTQRKRVQRRRARGPRRVNSQIYYRYVPRVSKKAYNLAVPRERRLRYKRFSGYFKQRLPHLEQGYYDYDVWPYYYKDQYGYAQPYTPYFSHYFTPFNDGHFTGYFQY